MLFYKIFDYFTHILLDRFERFIRNLNAKLIRESNIKLIESSDGIESTVLNNIIHTTGDIKREVLFDTDSEVTPNVKFQERLYYKEDGMDFSDGFIKLGDNKYSDLCRSGYKTIPIQHICSAVSLAVLTVMIGALIYLVVEYLVPRISSAGKVKYCWNTGLQSKKNHLSDDLSELALMNTYASPPNLQSNTMFHVHVEANAQIPDDTSKQTGDIEEKNQNFLSYDFIIDEYISDKLMGNMDLDLKHTVSNILDVKSNMASLNEPKLKRAQINRKKTEGGHEDFFPENLFPHNGPSFEYSRLHLESSSIISADSSPPQTIESDMQNNCIVTDEEFETSQQNCLHNLLHLYNETHGSTIPCFPITFQTKHNGDNACNEIRDAKTKYSSQEGISQTESDFSELEYISMYEKNDHNKRKIKPFTKLSKTKYSPLYSTPKFELSQSTIPVLSNKEQDPAIFFDLYTYLSLLDINDRLECLKSLSREYDNDTQQVKQLIELEILNLCSTSNEFEIQDIVKKLQCIISIEYDGDSPNISKIIQMYNDSFKRHILDLVALLKTPFADIIAILLCDYLSFANNNNIDIETYNHCLKTIIESTEFNEKFYKTISNAACIIVCALDFTMLPHTFFVIFNKMFQEEYYRPCQQIATLKCLKYYICFNKLGIINELTENPMENKVKCCGYQLVSLLLSNVLQIIRISQTSTITKQTITNLKHSSLLSINEGIEPLIFELIDTYLVIVEIFLNNDKIPSAIQYELLSSFITKIYTEIKSVVEADLRTLDPPILKELQVHFDLTQ